MTTTTKVKLVTNLKLLKKANACSYGLKTLLDSLPKNYSETQDINLLHILKSNGLNHFFWAWRALKKDNKRVKRLILHDIVKLAEPIYLKVYPHNDIFNIVLKALKTGRKLGEAVNAADAATRAARAAYASTSAAYASTSAAYAVYAAARAAVYAATRATRAAVYAGASVYAVYAAADYAAVYATAKKEMENKKIKIIKRYLK